MRRLHKRTQGLKGRKSFNSCNGLRVHFIVASRHVVMKPIKVSLAIAGFMSILSLAPAQLSNVTTPSLNLTAIAASNGSSVLECWQFPGFVASAQAGTSGALNLFLGDTANVSYTILPARFNGGLHTAPTSQYVSVLHMHETPCVGHSSENTMTILS